jgi:hypothetical protein
MTAAVIDLCKGFGPLLGRGYLFDVGMLESCSLGKIHSQRIPDYVLFLEYLCKHTHGQKRPK